MSEVNCLNDVLWVIREAGLQLRIDRNLIDDNGPRIMVTPGELAKKLSAQEHVAIAYLKAYREQILNALDIEDKLQQAVGREATTPMEMQNLLCAYEKMCDKPFYHAPQKYAQVSGKQESMLASPRE